MMIALAAILALHTGLAQADGWVWSLYEDGKSRVLNEFFIRSPESRALDALFILNGY